ncbi:MAG: hypothetical protein M1275_02900 [Patescibacteria group bacterium]|nr:hypothetical protein [Patescibacteria group bacterium]
MGQIRKFQKAANTNKVAKGFNISDVHKEFCLLYGEVAEAFEAYKFGSKGLGGELADVVIYLLGLSEMTGIDLEKEVEKKIKINRARRYAVSGRGHKRVKK